MFRKWIRDSGSRMKFLNTPLPATAHEYDFIYEYKP
jgi:hypothetical protein